MNKDKIKFPPHIFVVHNDPDDSVNDFLQVLEHLDEAEDQQEVATYRLYKKSTASVKRNLVDHD